MGDGSLFNKLSYFVCTCNIAITSYFRYHSIYSECHRRRQDITKQPGHIQSPVGRIRPVRYGISDRTYHSSCTAGQREWKTWILFSGDSIRRRFTYAICSPDHSCQGQILSALKLYFAEQDSGRRGCGEREIRLLLYSCLFIYFFLGG